jgi:hypothetical protein
MLPSARRLPRERRQFVPAEETASMLFYFPLHSILFGDEWTFIPS